jgi:multicomponent Na+:H+ antiporter subunit D
VSLGEQLPVLQVVVPLLAAPVCTLLRPRVAWAWATAVAWAAFAISIGLLCRVLEIGTISYALGTWAPPWGIEYRVDLLNAFIMLIISGTASVVLPYARTSADVEIAVERQHLFYCMMLLCLAGLLGMTVTGDAFNVFVFLEISSLSTYTLVALGRHRKALMSAFQYLVMGTIGATFFIIGVGLLYMMTGTLNMADLAQRLPGLEETRPIEAAYAFIAVGLALKLALFPLHLWLPNAYTYAPSAVSAFLAATATKVAIYVLIRFTFTIFGADFAFGAEPFALLLFVPALLAIFAGSIVACFQEHGKRLLAYSSVAQVGYIVLALSLANVDGLSAALVHVFNHALMKGALFLALGCVFYRLGSTRIDRMAGLGREMPWTMAAFVVGGLSLIGVPLTAGFISKWVLLQATFSLGLWWLAVLILGSSLIAIVYVGRVVEAAYFRPPMAGRPAVAEAPLSLLLPTWVLALANIYFGLDTSLSLGVASRAAAALLGASG